MNIDLENAKRSLLKLRRALKQLPPDPSAEDVHALRTQTRRLEAIVEALTPEENKKTRQLMKSVIPVRKAAGEVRDMDVLVGNVLALPRTQDNDDSLIRLVEHLGEMRIEGARELHHTVAANRKQARRSLKGYSKLVERNFPGKKGAIAQAGAAPAALAAELAKWPRLNAENIHDFRIKVKQLRYMLQLSRTSDEKLVEALGKVKDEVGDWHDWQELGRIAGQVLDPRTDRNALEKIEEIEKSKFKQALALANAVRGQYFHAGLLPVHLNGRSNGLKTKRQTRRSSPTPIR